jgi:cell division protein FtsQ
MASNSGQKSGSSGPSAKRKRVVIGARETVRVRYSKGQPEVEATPKGGASRGSRERSAGNRLAEARRQDRERRQASIRRRRIALALGAVVLVILGVVGLLQLRHASTFAIRDLRITGVSEVATATVRSLAAVPPGATLVDVNREAIATRVEQNPWVSSVTVSRDFPHTLVIRVTERKPGAWVNVSRRVAWLVSADSTWLRPRSKADTLTLPIITDAEGLNPAAGKATGSREVSNALAVLRQLSPQLKALVKFVSAPSVEKTAVVTKDGVQIFIGPATEMAKKDAVVRAILARQKGKLVYINVRTPDRPTWRGLEQP